MVTSDGSPSWEVEGDEEDTIGSTDQFSVSFLLTQFFLHVNCSGPTQFYTTSS
jgi:hypothetical protein